MVHQDMKDHLISNQDTDHLNHHVIITDHQDLSVDYIILGTEVYSHHHQDWGGMYIMEILLVLLTIHWKHLKECSGKKMKEIGGLGNIEEEVEQDQDLVVTPDLDHVLLVEDHHSRVV